jgi:hypothetical protein
MRKENIGRKIKKASTNGGKTAESGDGIEQPWALFGEEGEGKWRGMIET